MSGSNSASNTMNDGSDHDDEGEDPWEPGLRQRRRRSDRNSTNNGQGRRPNGNNSNSSRRDGTNENNNSRDTFNSNIPGSAAAGGNHAAGIGPCSGGIGGGAVGVLTSPTAGGGAMGTSFGGAPSTPYKTPTKQNDGLVAATPSSVTTAGETVESTLISQSPLTIRHRRRSTNRNNPTQQPPSLQRQYHLLRSQIILLLGSASIGLILFLLYALPLAAFISLALMTSSLTALAPVARSFLLARYEMEMQHPLGLTRYLPDSLRVMLTETSLHDFMVDTTFFNENRYLLLYFMPGLDPDQLMGFIDQLPTRHRAALLEPGLGRMMPGIMGHLMRGGDGRDDGAMNNAGDARLLDNGDDGSIASGLTVDHEHHGGENYGEDDDTVTLLDAVTGLPRTLVGFALDNTTPNNSGETPALPIEMPDADHPGVILNTAPANNGNHVENEDDDNSSIEFSIDLSAHGLTNMLGNSGANEAPVTAASTRNNSELRNVIVELPQSSNLQPNQQPTQNNEQEVQQQEIDLEGRILSQAASAAVANFTAQASAVAIETASEATDTASSWFIRAGSLTGLIAGGGGIVAAVLANRRVGSGLSLSVTLGSMSGLTRNGDSSPSVGGADGSSGNNAVSERRSEYPSAVFGLFATAAFGFVGAGFAYLVRNQVRASIAVTREKRLEDVAEIDDEADKP